MKKILIFGNSGSGKSSLAKELSDRENLAHLDLDTLAWLASADISRPPSRAPLSAVSNKIQEFVKANPNWVIEGCYSDLLDLVSNAASEIIFMDISIEQCCDNARNRSWEAHKYESKEAQDKNLNMLLGWIQDYEKRDDVFSYQSHSRLYKNFSGKKIKYINNKREEPL